jgi:hypothetical protein
LRSEPLGRHQPDGAHRMPEIAHNWISPVRIKVNASQIAVATAGAAQPEDRSAKQKTTFFDSIDPSDSVRFCHAYFGGHYRISGSIFVNDGAYRSSAWTPDSRLSIGRSQGRRRNRHDMEPLPQAARRTGLLAAGGRRMPLCAH